MKKVMKLDDLEDQTFYDSDANEIPPSDIIAYNELRSCSDLYRMYRQGILDIHPEFQREFVWRPPDQTRFIDSLIKQLPIPSMCFSYDYNKQKWQVIDGLQRISTIIRFLEGGEWTLSKLDDIDPKLSGCPVRHFMNPESDDHTYYQRIENLALPITILRCDYEKKSHTSYLFAIFHRLNTGGMKLTNQEIRNCIYMGSFNRLLKELNQNEKWQKINKIKPNVSYRFLKEEIILRFFALYYEKDEYKGRLAKFLNSYMERNKNPNQEKLCIQKILFNKTINLIYDRIYEGKIPKKLQVSVLEALLVGVAKNIDRLQTLSFKELKELYDSLYKHSELSPEKLKSDLSSKDRVLGRINAAISIFSGQIN